MIIENKKTKTTFHIGRQMKGTNFMWFELTKFPHGKKYKEIKHHFKNIRIYAIGILGWFLGFTIENKK
jgi:hypothetical protein